MSVEFLLTTLVVVATPGTGVVYTLTADPALVMAQLSGVFMALTLLVFVGYGVCAAAVRDRVISSERALAWLRRTFAASFLALGAKLAFTDR